MEYGWRRTLARRAAGLGTALALAAAGLVAPAVSASPATAGNLQSHLLTLGDLPPGWTAPAHPKTGGVKTSSSCLSGLANDKRWHSRYTFFLLRSSLPEVVEGLATGPGVADRWAAIAAAVHSCRSATLTQNGRRYRARINSVTFPEVKGAQVEASAWNFSVSGVAIGLDLVLLRVGRYVGELSYVALGAPELTTAAAFVRAAVSKAAGGRGRVTGTVSVVTAPLSIAHTALGDVSYRIVGEGRPLVLIMGYAGTMATWDPRFVDALAHHFRVLIFDNPGIGGSAALRGQPSIEAMANRTSDLMTSLGLGPSDVLGWSMGGMVAQALAVLHPSQVRRLVLCATFPGSGSVEPAQSAVDALTSGSTSKVLGVLFPPGHVGAGRTYLVATSSWPDAPPAPPSVVAAQRKAVLRWWHGQDVANRGSSGITAPTLVADGISDKIDPVANDRALATSIPGAHMVLYEGAGHAFLFQLTARFVATVVAFSA